jgi:hypothetical protein
MKEAYVKIETAQLLKEKGFDWECCNHFYCRKEDGKVVERWMLFPADRNSDRWVNKYAEYISAPTQQMAMRWLREEHGIMITPDRDKIVNVAPEPFYDYWCTIRHNGNEHWVSSLDLPDSQHYTEYEDVVEAALKYCLTNLI